MKELVQVVQTADSQVCLDILQQVLDISFTICRGPPTIFRKDSASTLHGGPISDDLTG